MRRCSRFPSRSLEGFVVIKSNRAGAGASVEEAHVRSSRRRRGVLKAMIDFWTAHHPAIHLDLYADGDSAVQAWQGVGFELD